MEQLERSQSHSGRQSGLEDEGCGLMRLLARRELSAKKQPMEWSQSHDVLLCREILAVDPFQAKPETSARAKIWEKVALNLEKIDKPKFEVSIRAVRDRYTLLAERYKKKACNEKRASGISPESTELDTLLKELTEKESASDKERRTLPLGEKGKRIGDKETEIGHGKIEI